MKPSAKIAVPILLALVLDSCALVTNPNMVRDTLEDGSWGITYYWDENQDKTTNFTGYEFLFLNSGSLVATSGNNAVAGAWTVSEADDDIWVTLSFEPDPVFGEIGRNWRLMERKKDKIRLDDVDSTGTSLLTLEK